jgi:AcrR family transcriptional regulator
MTVASPPPARRVRNPRGAGAALGLQIVAAALEAVDDAGVPGLTLRGLARSIGVSAPAIYAHFADIDAILLAVSERAFADLSGHLSAAADPTAEPPARLRAISRAYLDYAEQHPGRYQVMFGGQWDATSAVERRAVERQAVEDLGLNVVAVFIDAVQASRGGTSQGDPLVVRTAVTTWVLLHGYAHQRLVARAFPWPPDMTEHVLDSVVAASSR